jgi:SWI/SNF-related matrix-associated actin-dependent regulator of chromatin subfamily A-like protein 1
MDRSSRSPRPSVTPGAASVDAALEAQAAAFAGLLDASNDVDAAFRTAVALADGLFPHQVEGVAFLLGRRRAILADDMGLGKTRQAIVSLRHAAPGGPCLVLCPASVKRNWAREIALAAPGASTLVIEGRGAVEPDAEWVIANYDVLGAHVDALGRVPWGGLVFDEVHYLKNHTSTRSRLARQLAERAVALGPHPPAVYLLTGTPLTSRPRDLFVLLQLVGHPLGRSFLSFARRYCAAEKTQYGWKTTGASNVEELTVQLHGVMLRRAKDQVLALPPKLRTWLPVDVPTRTGAQQIRQAIALLFERQRTNDAPRSADAARARGRVLALLTRARQRLAVAKTATTLELVRGTVDQGQKVIVYSCFDEPLRTLARELGTAAVLLTGKTPAGDRQAVVDRFQLDDDVSVFLANIVAGGIGVTLTAATQVVFNDLDWTPANHWQAEDRAYRIGQTRTVNVTYLVGRGTVDDFVQAVLETKGALVAAVIDGQAIAGDVPGDVLDELLHAIRVLSPGLADGAALAADEAIIEGLLEQAADSVRAAAPPVGAVTTMPRTTTDREALRRAFEALLKVLSGPDVKRFRITSASHAGVAYEIVVTGSDVTCSCPGFEYRGQCRHAREVKARLADRKPLPAEYAEVI